MLASYPAALRGLAKTATVIVATLAAVTGTAFSAAAETGVDVSRWQHGTSLSWSSVKADGISFAFIKATEGRSYTNPYFASDWSATRSVGIYHGAYHFARPSVGSAAAQARYFVSRAGLADAPGDLPPVLDLEATGGLGVSALRSWTATWLKTVHDLTGRRPIIYTSPSFWESDLGNSTAFRAYPLWIAHYTTGSPRVPGGWDSWTFWQSTSRGRVSGISGDVDMNTFNGTRVQLKLLANIRPPAPAPAPPPAPAPDPEPVSKTPTTTSLETNRTRVYAGRSVTLSGNVAVSTGEPLGGRTVRIFRRDSGATTWTRIAAVRSDRAGGYTLPVQVSGPASYMATFPGGTRYARSSSEVRSVAIRPKAETRVTLNAERAVVRRGQRVKLYGHLTTEAGRAITDRRVNIYQRASGSSRWTLVSSGTSLSPTGWYQAYAKPTADSTYKAVFAGALRYNADTSNRTAVAVR